MNFDFTTIETLLVALGGLLTTIIGFLQGKKMHAANAHRAEAEAKAQEIENKKSLVEIYQDSIKDLEDQYRRKTEELVLIHQQKVKMLEDVAQQFKDVYEKKIELLEMEIKQHKQTITKLKRENKDLTERIKQLEQEIQ